MVKKHNETTRVQLPAILHLMRLGYKYLETSSRDRVERDRQTNILTSIFKKQFLLFNNYATEDDFLRELANIRLELDQNDLGRSFFDRLQGKSDYTYIDWEQPERNTFHVAWELTAKNGEDNFRPDIVVFVNGLPLSYIEVKQPDAVRDGKTGMDSEKERTAYRFKNRKFRRFNNLTQILAISDNQPYDEKEIHQKQGSYYATTSFSTTKFNAFKEERQDELVGKLGQLSDEMIQLVLEDTKHLPIRETPEFKTNLSPESPCNQFLTSLYTKERLLFLFRYGLVYVEEIDEETGQLQFQKHIMRYPQYFATRAIEEVISSGRTKGVIWHTQGSGKTALAFFNVRYLTDVFSKKGIVPNFYFVVDRLDLAN